MTGLPRSAKLPADTPLFTVPSGLIRILDRDLTLAGIPKRDERGRTIDVHSMRTSFCSLLSKAGIAPRTAMAAARHSGLSLTMGAYTDPALLDVAGALDALPALPLDGASDDPQEQRATGTFGKASTFIDATVAPTVAPNVGDSGATVAIADNTAAERRGDGGPATIALTPWNVKRNNPLTTAVNGLREKRAKGLEPSTSSLGS